MFLRKGVLKICSKFTGEHLRRSAVLIKLQSKAISRRTYFKFSFIIVVVIVFIFIFHCFCIFRNNSISLNQFCCSEMFSLSLQHSFVRNKICLLTHFLFLAANTLPHPCIYLLIFFRKNTSQTLSCIF